MDRRDAKYYDAHAQTINLDKITSNEQNATILQKLRDNDPEFISLSVRRGYNTADNNTFSIAPGDDSGWFGYFIGQSTKLQNFRIEDLFTETVGDNRNEAFIEGLNRNRSIETLHIDADLGSSCFRKMGDYFRSNNNLKELTFGENGFFIESAPSIAFMLSQCKESKLQKISLENCRLDDEELVEIVAAIGTLSNVEELDLEGNCLSTDGSVALGGALKACKNPQLRWLFLGENCIDDGGLRALADGMRNCHNLTRLSLHGNESITVDGARALSTLLQSEHCWLEYIDLSDINIDDDTAHAIAAGLESLPSLETLYLQHNSIGDGGARAIAAGLVNLRSLEDLSLRDSAIGDTGMRAIASRLVNIQSLVRLDLGYNSIGDVGATAIGAGLAKLPSLVELDLEGNSIGHVGVEAIASGLVNLRLLEKIHLGRNSIGDVGATAISAGLAKLQSLEELDLGYNSIGDVGAKGIATGLVKLQSLKELNLAGNSIGDVGARAIAAGLVKLQSIKELSLGGNSIGDLGIQALVIGLINSVDLKQLILSKNRTITASGLSSLSTILQSESCSLTEILVWDIPFGDEGAAALADALKGNKSMKHLKFDPDSVGVTSVGWSAFSKLLCDTSSVSNTYLSNHSLERIGGYINFCTPDDLKQLLALSKHPAEHVAIHKILKSHSDFDIEPFFEWKLKLLPLVVAWFERVRSLADEHCWILKESAQVFQSRQLSTMYNFVRGMPLVAIDGYRSRNNTAVLASSRKRKVDQLS